MGCLTCTTTTVLLKIENAILRVAGHFQPTYNNFGMLEATHF